MAYTLKQGRPVARELSRIAAKEIKAALEALSTRSKAGAWPAVHAVRKHVKKTRALLRLFETDLDDHYRRFNGRLRAVAHRLSPLRDADAVVATMKGLRDHYPRMITPPLFRPVDRALQARKRGAASGLRAERLLAEASSTLRKARASVPHRIRRVAGSKMMRGGAGRGYRRARQEMARVATEPEDLRFHAWRRRVKDHWYHMRLHEGLNVRAHARDRQLKQMQTWLGDDHNLVVLRAAILKAPARFGDERTVAVILGCIEKYQATLRRRSLEHGRRLFAHTPSEFRQQIDRWFRRR
jgi:CHAD domain-containing protein